MPAPGFQLPGVAAARELRDLLSSFAGSPLLVALCLFFGFAPSDATAQERPPSTILLSSGSPEGAYHRTATAIADHLNSQSEASRVEVVPSSGSEENLDRLRDGLTDWAIVQRDLAVDAYYAAENPLELMQVVLPLFPEAVHVFVDADAWSPPSEREGLAALVEAVRRGEVTRIAVGPPGSGSARTARRIFALFGLPRESGVYLEAPSSESFDLFSSGEVDALVVTWAYPGRPFDEFDNAVLLSLPSSEVARIREHLPHLDRVSIPTGTYPYQDGSVTTVGTWSLLVARKDDESLVPGSSSVPSTVLRMAGSDPGLGRVARAYGPEGTLRVDSAGDRWKIATSPPADLQTFLRGLPQHPELAELVEDEGPPFPAVGLAPLLVLLLLAFVWWRRNRGGEEAGGGAPGYFRSSLPRDTGDPGLPGPMKELWVRYKHYAYGLLFLGIVFLLTGIATKYFEQQFSQAHLIQSPFGHRSLGQIWHWLLIYSVSGYTGGVFPVSPVAKVAASLLMPLTWAGVGCAVIGEFLFRERRKRRLSGMEPVNYEGHVVICGWNDRVPVLIRKCLQARENFLDGDREIRFVVLDDRFKPALDEQPDLQALHKRQELDYINGDAKDAQYLERANVSAADTMILVADDRTHHADEHTLLRALAISRYCRRVADQSALDSIYIIAEVNNEEYAGTLLDSDVNEVVSPPDLSENVLIQSTFNHGLSEIFHNLLNYNTANEFYLIDVADHPFLAGLTFDEALVELRRVKILLVAVKVVFREEGEEIIDREEIGRRLEASELERQVITNPIFEGESAYRIREDDRLFVLAKDERAIQEGLADLEPDVSGKRVANVGG